MKLLEGVRLALRALTTNKLRSALTMLGIIIGVGAVITLMSVGEGVQAYITNQFEAIGTNLFFVIPGSFQQQLQRPAYLTLKDADAIADPVAAPDVLRVAPLVQGTATVTTPGYDRSVTVDGVTPEYEQVRNWPTTTGQFISSADEQARGRVAVLGSSTAAYFFPETPDPTGEIIRINGSPFRVIGVLEKRGGSSFQNEDDVILIPLSTALSRIFPRRTNTGEPRLSLIYVQATSEGRMNAAISEVSIILRQRHRIGPGQPDDFTAISQADLVGTFQQITGVLTTFLGAIAGISLLVGGIGIMNIMLGICHRKDARDRSAKSRRGPEERYPVAIPERGHHALHFWGRYWDPDRGYRRDGDQLLPAAGRLPGCHHRRSRGIGDAVLGIGRAVLWHLPRPTGGGAQSD